jgi:hypothetical protein
MRKERADEFLQDIEAAMPMVTDTSLATTPTGKKQHNKFPDCYLIPVDLAEVIRSAGAEFRTQVFAASLGCNFERQADGSVKITRTSLAA